MKKMCVILSIALTALMTVSGSAQTGGGPAWRYIHPDDTLVLDVFPYNSKADDYAPLSLKNGGFLFTSSRNNHSSDNRVLFGNENIWHCRRLEARFSSPALSEFLNSDDQTAIAGVSGDHASVFIYKSFDNGDLYVTRLEEGKWQPSLRMGGIINSPYHEQSAATFNGLMVWSSDRPGGKGGHDLYWCRAGEDGQYTEAIPLNAVNTGGEEMDVRFGADGRYLYFCSDGLQPGETSFDIWRTALDSNGQWMKPEALGFPVNTPHNDRDFFDADSVFFLASDRPGGSGDYDIYKGWVMSPKPSIRKLRLAAYNSKAQTDTLIVIEKDRYGVMNDILDSAGFTEYYARVQIGAFSNLTVEQFKAAHPSLRSTPIIIEWVRTDRGRIGKFMVDKRFASLKDAAIVQEEMWNRHNIRDAFIAVYNTDNERIAIYNSIKGEFVMLSAGAKPVIF